MQHWGPQKSGEDRTDISQVTLLAPSLADIGNTASWLADSSPLPQHKSRVRHKKRNKADKGIIKLARDQSDMCQDSDTGDIIVRCNTDTPNTREVGMVASHWMESEKFCSDWMPPGFLRTMIRIEDIIGTWIPALDSRDTHEIRHISSDVWSVGSFNAPEQMSDKWKRQKQNNPRHDGKMDSTRFVSQLCRAVRGGWDQGEDLTIPDITWTIRVIRVRRGNNKAIVVRVCLIMEIISIKEWASSGLNIEYFPATSPCRSWVFKSDLDPNNS